MKIKSFKGDYYNIGKQQGEIYKKNGKCFKNIKIDEKLYKNQLKIYKKHYPELLEELKGMAKGGDFDEEKLIYSFICGELEWFRTEFKLSKACTIFGVKSKDNLLVGRNYDWVPHTEKFFEVYKVENPKANNYFAISDMGVYGNPVKKQLLFYNADDTINDKGLFVGITFAFCKEWNYGLSCIHFTKLIAEKCKTLDDVLKLFKKVPLCCPKNFFIADAKGRMAVVEHTSQKFKILRPKDNTLIQTNHYVDPELAKVDTVLEAIPEHNTFIRYYETLQRINIFKKNFKFQDIINTLCNTKTYTCQNFPGIKTIWTLALDMKKKNYKVYYDLFNKRKSITLKF